MTATAEIETYIQAMHNAGCPRDQAQRFVSAGYVSLPQLLPFHACARQANDRTHGIREIMLDGTRGSAKSHAIIAQVGIDDCQTYSGLKYLFLRQTQKAAGESFEDLVGRVLRGVPHQANSEKITFPNRSRIVIGGFKNPSDIDKYIGIEYDGVVLEEATQITGEKYMGLMGSVRTSRNDWVPRVYLSTNPGRIGHQFYKERFILPQRENRETFTRRFFSSYQDNPFINPEYKTYLESLTGVLAKAWRDGDWDIFAGQAFPEWNRSAHTCRPFQIPEGWVKWRAIDWGYAAPFACLWFAKDLDTQRIYVYRELYQTQLTDRSQARMVKEYTPKNEKIARTYADPSMWAKKNARDFVTSAADEYAAEGVILTSASNDRIDGKRKVHRRLAPLPDGKPGLIVFDTLELCEHLPALITDDINIEDVDTTQDDHDYDALRYGLTDDRETKKQEQRKPHPLERMKQI